jgi:hypothetical protein
MQSAKGCEMVVPAKHEGGYTHGGILGAAERVVLKCERCEERTVLGKPEEVWLSGPTDFKCGGCGRRLTLADRLDAELLIESGERGDGR